MEQPIILVFIAMLAVLAVRKYREMKPEKQSLIKPIQYYYDALLAHDALEEFSAADGLKARWNVLLKYELLSKDAMYTVYLDRLFINECWELWTYDESQSVEYMSSLQQLYFEKQDDGTLSAEELYETLSLDDKIEIVNNANVFISIMLIRGLPIVHDDFENFVTEFDLLLEKDKVTYSITR